jgi:hypothetical protein
MIPIESTFVTSSYVRVPAIETLPPTVTLPVIVAEEAVKIPTLILGTPVSPVALPEKLVAVTTPTFRLFVGVILGTNPAKLEALDIFMVTF